LRSSLALVFDKRENDNGAKGITRGYLAKFKTTSTSAALRTDHSGFNNGALFGPGIDFYPPGVVLGDNI
jgi:hypothetical protein